MCAAFELAAALMGCFILPVLPVWAQKAEPSAPPAQKAQSKALPSPVSSAALQSYALTLPGSVVKVDMIAIPGGTLAVGGKAVPVKPFWMASMETSWEAFDAFQASGPPSKAYDQTKYDADAIARPSKSYILPDLGWGHHGFPAINISILSATMYCRWLSTQTGHKYRLPTEAEWEYACRAGAKTNAPLAPAQLDKVAWYAGNSDKRSRMVGKKQPNAWKLYDMLGNVGEWAIDADGKQVLCGGTFKDEAGKVGPGARERQTSAWQQTDPQLPKSRWWLSDGRFVGFRVVREP